MLSQAGLEISIYFEVTCCSAGSLLACKRMNTKPAGSSLQPRWKLPRDALWSCRSRSQNSFMLSIPSVLSYWAVLPFTERFLWAVLRSSHCASVLQRMWKKVKPRTKEKFCWSEKYGDGRPSHFLQNCGEVCASTVLKMTHEDDLRGVKAVGTQLSVLSSERLCALKRPVRTGMARSAHLSGEVQLC